MPGTAAEAPFLHWDAARYLRDYYGRLERDEELTLRFLVRQFAAAGPRRNVLEFGSGPTIHHLLPLAPHVGALDVADYLPANLQQVQRWLRRSPGAHDWRAFTRHVLACEGRPAPDALDLCMREDLTRRRVRRLLHCDAAREHPLGTPLRRHYDALISCFCADSATDCKLTWRRYMANMLGLLKPGGLFVGAALRRCRRYRVGQMHFPCADVDEGDVEETLRQAGCSHHSIRIEVEAVPQQRTLGYDGILLVAAVMGA